MGLAWSLHGLGMALACMLFGALLVWIAWLLFCPRTFSFITEPVQDSIELVAAEVETVSDEAPADLIDRFEVLSPDLEDNDKFNEFFIKEGVETKVYDVGLEVKGCVDFNVKMRMAPLEDAEELSRRLTSDEGLQIAGTVIDIEDAKGFLSPAERGEC